MESNLGIDVVRKEAWDKVTGSAKYTNDIKKEPMLYAKLLTSSYAHAKIIKIDTSSANTMPGVKAIITANDTDVICGPMLQDRPPLAKDKARYFGEPIAIVVANKEEDAAAAILKIKVDYEPLPVVNSIQDSISPGAILIHENLANYKKAAEEIYPIINTNICHLQKIRKGDINKGFNESEIIIEGSFNLPQSDHAAMETRSAKCTIMPTGQVIIDSSSQSPFAIKEQISQYFSIPVGNIDVKIPFVGGGFGGKSAVQLEVLAVLSSMAVDGKCVTITNSREQDLVTSPCHLGCNATIKLGAKKNGQITATQMTFHLDSGAYSDISPKIAKAIAVDCAGPYHIPNINCDCFAVYTNHAYITSFRGFGHISLAFCIERMMDKLALALNLDPIDIRMINGLKEGDLTPTGAEVTYSNTGNFNECLNKLKTLINWNEGKIINENNNLIRVKGIGCFNKTSDSPTDASSSVILTFNSDGSININCGAVEIGPGTKTTLTQILAEKLRMNVNNVSVKMEVDTSISPIHWKTVASMTTYMLGQAVINAADDLIRQLKDIGSVVMNCSPDELDIADKKIFLKSNPLMYTLFKDIVYGFKYPEGKAVGGPIIGRGNYMMTDLTILDKETGYGRAGKSWTVGAQGIEIEYDTKQHTYRILKVATVIDAGKVINPKAAKGVIMGAMSMGLGLATSEAFTYDENAIPQNTSFRTYKMIRYGEEPEYLVEFVETPQTDAPYGARGIAEHGIIGITPALANAISLATNLDINRIPITPEDIWKGLNS